MKLKFLWFPLIVGIMFLIGVGTARATTVYANLGPISLPIPWDNVNAVYLYSVTEKQNEVGGEAVFAQIKVGTLNSNPMDINLTVGGVLNPGGSTVGTGFAGANLMLPVSSSPALQWLSPIEPGLFGGFDINRHLWIFGLKAALPIFKG